MNIKCESCGHVGPLDEFIDGSDMGEFMSCPKCQMDESGLVAQRERKAMERINMKELRRIIADTITNGLMDPGGPDIPTHVIGALKMIAMAFPEEFMQTLGVGLKHIGWMPSAKLAQEANIGPLDHDYLTTIEAAEHDGGIRPELQDKMLRIYCIYE